MQTKFNWHFDTGAVWSARPTLLGIW